MNTQPERTVILGTRREGVIYAIRARGCPVAGVTAIGNVASVPDDGDDAVQAARLEAGGRAGEPFIMADANPMLYGSAVALRLPKVDGNHPVVRDVREVLQSAEWQASNDVREQAAEFFGCELQDIIPRGTIIERLRETVHEVAVTVLHMCEPEWESEDSPEGDMYVLPLLLANMVGKEKQAEAILWVDEDRTVFLSRKAHIVREVRTIACGMRDIQECIEEEVSCSEAESSALLAKWEKSELPDNLTHIMCQSVENAGELLTGAVRMILSDIAEHERPSRFVISGLYPSIAEQVFMGSRGKSSIFIDKNSVEILGKGGGRAWARAVLEQAVSGLFRAHTGSPLSSSGQEHVGVGSRHATFL